MQTINYFADHSAATIPLGDGLHASITRVTDDVANVSFQLDGRSVPIPTGYACWNMTTDRSMKQLHDGWPISWASTYTIAHNGERRITIECQRTHTIYAHDSQQGEL